MTDPIAERLIATVANDMGLNWIDDFVDDDVALLMDLGWRPLMTDDERDALRGALSAAKAAQ